MKKLSDVCLVLMGTRLCLANAIGVAMPILPRYLLLCALLLFLLPACSPKGPSALSPGYTDAVELKLKSRELADQMLATMPNDALQGFVAMPTAFVDQNNTSRTSPLGRLMAESLFYEFNQRGFPTREYRLNGTISVQGGRDDLALAANQLVPTTGQKWAALVVGTYYVDADATFVNARLVRASDGLVMRTGQLVLVNTPIIARMAKSDAPTAPPKPQSGSGVHLGSSNRNAGHGTRTLDSNDPLTGLYTPAASIGSGSMRIRQGR